MQGIAISCKVSGNRRNPLLPLQKYVARTGPVIVQRIIPLLGLNLNAVPAVQAIVPGVVALPYDIDVPVVWVRQAARQQRGHVNRHVGDGVEYHVMDTIVEVRVHRYRGFPTGPTIVAPDDESPVIRLQAKSRGGPKSGLVHGGLFGPRNVAAV